MRRFIEEASRSQGVLLPETIEEYVAEENPVRVIDAFVESLDLAKLGFERVEPEATGRPGYHPATMLKIYLYGYLNRIQSSRRLEQEAHRNLALMWLVGRLAPDFKTLADFRAENTAAIKNVCREFIVLCRRWNLAHGSGCTPGGEPGQGHGCGGLQRADGGGDEESPDRGARGHECRLRPSPVEAHVGAGTHGAWRH